MNQGSLLGITRRWWCHIIAAAVSLFVVVPITFMAMDRVDPVQLITQEVTGDPRPGGAVQITWEAISARPCTGDARSRIISSDSIIYDYLARPTVIRSRSAERGKYALEFTLPNGIAAGPARRETYVRYFCNPLQYWLNWPITATRNVNFVIRR